MTRLFIRFYVGVLVVLFLAWFIHARVSTDRSRADFARVVTTAHTGGARLVAEQLNAADPDQRENVLQLLQNRFDYDVRIDSLSNVPNSARKQLAEDEDTVVFSDDTIVVALSDGESVVRLGEFPNFQREQIEAGLAGWMRIARDQIGETRSYERGDKLLHLQSMFAIPVGLRTLDELPQQAVKRISETPDSVAFYRVDNGTWYSAIQLDNVNAVRFGPFASFEDIDQKAATTTLALVLLPAAIAIALLLRPVAWQLRQLENAAQTMAKGDLSVRVDQTRMKSAKPLAHAFNDMASRTESLVRTQRELLQAVSHELRTPLSRMRFAIDLIETAKTDEERNERLRTLDASTEELNGLVGELLSYVRMETAELQIDREPIVLSETLDVLFPKFSGIHPGIDFSGEVTTENAQEEITVNADRVGFQRAIGNLISNAARYAESRVEVHARVEDGAVIIDVDDDGNGIPEADRSRVFEPFVRLQSIGEATGVGLGLALVQRIVLQHEGSVTVQSSPLGGCRVQTKWPQAYHPLPS